MVSDIIDTITEWVTGFIEILVGGLEAFVEVFYVPGADGGLTALGILALLGLAVGLVTLVISFVRGLFQR